jgi:hypothetical protein
VVLAVTDDVGVRTIVDVLLEEHARRPVNRPSATAAGAGDANKSKQANNQPPDKGNKQHQADDAAANERKRLAAVMLLSGFCVKTKVDLSPIVPQLLRGLLHLFAERDQVLLHCAWEALSAVSKVGFEFHSIILFLI